MGENSLIRGIFSALSESLWPSADRSKLRAGARVRLRYRKIAHACVTSVVVIAEQPDPVSIHSQIVRNVLKRVTLAFDNFLRRIK
jgi:hypothetical protein